METPAAKIGLKISEFCPLYFCKCPRQWNENYIFLVNEECMNLGRMTKLFRSDIFASREKTTPSNGDFTLIFHNVIHETIIGV